MNHGALKYEEGGKELYSPTCKLTLEIVLTKTITKTKNSYFKDCAAFQVPYLRLIKCSMDE